MTERLCERRGIVVDTSIYQHKHDSASRCTRRSQRVKMTYSSAPLRRSNSSIFGMVCLLMVLLSDLNWYSCHGVMPTAELDVFSSDGQTSTAMFQYTLLASQASFGRYPPMRPWNQKSPPLPKPGNNAASNKNGDDDESQNSMGGTLQLPPSNNPDLCSSPSSSSKLSSPLHNKVVLVPRGTCTFERKAFHAQQLGAKAMILYGSLSSHYALNTTTASDDKDDDAGMNRIIWPEDKSDYDCDKGSAMIPDSALSFQPLPYNYQQNDAVLSGATSQNLCRKYSSNSLEECPSQACLLTGNKSKQNGRDDEFSWQACCAWDLFIWLYADSSFASSEDVANSTTPAIQPVVTIPAVYLTWLEGQQLLQSFRNNPNLYVSFYERWRPEYNPSSTIIWLLAVLVAALAAHLSAHDYHEQLRRVLRRKARNGDAGQNNAGGGTSRAPPAPQEPQRQQQPEETLELNAWHALGFLVMASTSLLVLFYFKIYGFVKVMYAFGCSKALATIAISPVLKRIMKRINQPNRVVWDTRVEDIGVITVRDLVAHMISFTLGLTWLIMAFAYNHPETITFFWVLQDIFGACMCVLFVQVVKLNSIRVAAILLVIAFFYDIFFVFITPLIFTKSVMLDVATSGGPPPNPDWCEKYPNDPHNCGQRGNPLPMLFTIPRIADYQGGANLLGLGDIVVPGLLISFAARLDAAKKLLGVMGGGNGSLGRSYSCPEQKICCGIGTCCCNGGYYFPLVVAYAVGLLMANAAVYYTEMGQPALLYLVPCCLGMILFVGWKRGEMTDLWDGPKVIRSADVVCYGEENVSTSFGTSSSGSSTHSTNPNNSGFHTPLPQDEDDFYSSVSYTSSYHDSNHQGV